MSQDKARNYKKLFFVGIVFIGAGIVLTSSAGVVGTGLLGLGIAFLVIGAKHRGEWKD